MIKRILIANRGEIAVRIIKACHKVGVEAVSVFSEADREAKHVAMSDDSVFIGSALATHSYLNPAALLIAAKVSGCDSLHPGYGFLSENADFVESCTDFGLNFIGPSAEHVRLMGDKAHARQAAREAGVPIIEGVEPGHGEEGLLNAAESIGFPVLLKATSGGGGRGMWKVTEPSQLLPTFRRARGEAATWFNDDNVYLEKYLGNARHVEVQILGDKEGNILNLGERDCSLQRRHQKVLEESACTEISEALSSDLREAATTLAERCGYIGAGTVEFVVDLDRQEFFFIEMNTRIQVEHPVTEVVTGIDLVAAQIRIANGDALEWRQDSIRNDGHSIECRINAERPDRNFMPCPGRIVKFDPPKGGDVRCDTHCFSGYVVPPNYDSLIAKLIVHGKDRNDAIERMQAALRVFTIDGIETTIPMHLELLGNEDFRKGRYNTEWMENVFVPGMGGQTSSANTS